MRIALVSPYSWTYPGGVTRHIEALAAELSAAGHEPRVLAPLDPDDALARRLHRGARPQAHRTPAGFVSLGRTIGLPANGAVSNLALTPTGVSRLRAELRCGRYDVVHIHEPIAPFIGWDALGSAPLGLPLVGTFHAYSTSLITNGGAKALGAGRRFNRLHARIAVSEAAAWTARRFYGGRYRIVPNGVGLPADSPAVASADERPLRILFVGLPVERKGLPVLLRAFEALRDHIPATLTLVGPGPDDVAPLLLDARGVDALGKVSDAEKTARLAEADVLCAPSLHGESFGMVLTEAFAAAVPVVASNIPGYRDVVRHDADGLLTPPGDALALAEALRLLALEPQRRRAMALAARERAERFAWPHVAAEVAEVYEQAIAVGSPRRGLHRLMVRHGFAPADLKPAIPARRLASLEPALTTQRGPLFSLLRRLGLLGISLAGLALALLALSHIGVDQVLASLLASSPGLLVAGLALMCASMVARGFAWHAILSVAPTWRRARRRDAMQGTFIGVLMSATLPARLGEPSRALIVARRLGRARETLPVVLGTMVSQTLLNLVALCILGIAMFSNVNLLDGHHGALIASVLAPLGVLAIVLLAPALVPRAAVSRSTRLQALMVGLRRSLVRVRAGLRVFRHPRQAGIATASQLGAWGLQWMSCWLLLMALGLDHHVGVAGAAAVLFAVNVTAVVPATPANIGVFQAACVAVLAGAYHVSTPDALAYGIILQVVEVLTAVLMGMPALVKEGLSWKDVRLRTMHAAPVKLPALPDKQRAAAQRR
ncbi:MAG TPA: lysylphosphatidylglycerol synthase domain-containing protein [Solirubrobacteraceae bacterium]|nr:lysylphosphatidylglycerol synthase domain-containing protein [Solirubrobacteraceae bacterium]